VLEGRAFSSGNQARIRTSWQSKAAEEFVFRIGTEPRTWRSTAPRLVVLQHWVVRLQTSGSGFSFESYFPVGTHAFPGFVWEDRFRCCNWKTGTAQGLARHKRRPATWRCMSPDSNSYWNLLKFEVLKWLILNLLRTACWKLLGLIETGGFDRHIFAYSHWGDPGKLKTNFLSTLRRCCNLNSFVVNKSRLQAGKKCKYCITILRSETKKSLLRGSCFPFMRQNSF